MPLIMLHQLYNIKLSHVTIADWCKKFAPILNSISLKLIPMMDFNSDEWHADETVVKINGKKHYIWFIIDSETRFVLGFHLSPYRDSSQAHSLYEHTAHLCKTYGLSVGKIVSHKEAHQKGYGNNHGDPEHWMKNFGETMDDFRNMVSEILKSKEEITGNKQETTNAESATVGEISDGDLVSIAGNATYYSGKSIPDWVKKQRWYVKGTPTTDRVIIYRNESGTNSICSPIHRKYLTVVKAAATHNVSDSVNITACPYRVKIMTDMLDIRQGAGMNTAKVGCITDRGVYTIVAEQSGAGASKWGKLKSGAGWISLDDTKRI